MASVCSATLAMLDAGVPLTSMIAGIAMGLLLPATACNMTSAIVNPSGKSSVQRPSLSKKYKPVQEQFPGARDKESAVILSDILGLEDALGAMDLKIAGNETAITAFQLDIKTEGLTVDLLAQALKQVSLFYTPVHAFSDLICIL
jgi:polyribonucleotide nucleotidyltransferase